MGTPSEGKAYPPDIEAEIKFVSASEGGRATPIYSGYRPQFSYDGMDWDAVQEYPDVELVHPGQTVRAMLRFTRPDVHAVHIKVGMEFHVKEGSRVIGYGRVTRILDLLDSAARSMTRS